MSDYTKILSRCNKDEMKKGKDVYNDFLGYKEQGLNGREARECLSVTHRMDYGEIGYYISIGKACHERDAHRKAERKRRKSQPPVIPDYMKPGMASRYLGIPKDLLKYYTEEGKIAKTKPDGSKFYSYHRTELDRFRKDTLEK